MQPEHLDAPIRAGRLLRREVRDHAGHVLGRIADVETKRGDDGIERVVAVLVTPGRWGRLLGYERDETVGPWLLEKFAHLVLRRDSRRVPLDELQL